MFEDNADPRLSNEHVRTVTTAAGRITLVGVVHDHPASVFRAREVVSRREPAVLGLELPPLAVPLFREYARDKQTPPSFGGEMSAAIQAADTDRLVGIDGPSRRFMRQLAASLVEERADSGTIRSVAEALAVASKSAITSRFAAIISQFRATPIDVSRPWEYDVDITDSADLQAADERQHLGRAQALSASLIPPTSKRIRDEVREKQMVAELASVADAGEVVAIVGRNHLDPVASELTNRSRSG